MDWTCSRFKLRGRGKGCCCCCVLAVVVGGREVPFCCGCADCIVLGGMGGNEGVGVAETRFRWEFVCVGVVDG